MARYTDEQRSKAEALWDGITATTAALDKFEDDNEDRLAAIAAEYEGKRVALNERFEQEAKALEERQQAEAEAFEAEVAMAKGMTDLAAAADVAFDAWQASGLPDLKRYNGEVMRCATSGKLIFWDDDIVRKDDKIHLACEVEETAAA